MDQLPNIKIHTDETIDDAAPFKTPLEHDELRIIVLGGVGRGKTHTLMRIQQALAQVMPDTEVVLMNGAMLPNAIAKYAESNTEALAALSQRVVKRVSLYESQTNNIGQVRGVKLKE